MSAIVDPMIDTVTIIIPVWNSGEWLPSCLESLSRQLFQNFSIIIVDNGSVDGSVESVRTFSIPKLKIVSFAENRGFAAAVNEGIRMVTGKYVVLLNADIIAAPDWLAELVRVIEQCPESIGALASGMVKMDAPHLVDDAGDILSWYGSASKRGHGEPVTEYQQQEEVFSVCAGAGLYRKEFFAKVGLFDERFTNYLEDIDLCLRGRIMGYRYLYVPGAKVHHKGHSAGVAGSYYVFLMTRNRLMLFLKNIPCYLFFRHLHQIIYGQFYFFVVYRKPMASLRGYLSLLKKIKHIIYSRKALFKVADVDRQLTDSLLSSTLGAPSLMDMVKRKLMS